MRIVWNITLNTDINDAAALCRAIKLINELSQNGDKIYSFLADEKSVIVLHSSEKAIKEERLKASYICKDNTWEKIFINAEKQDVSNILSYLFAEIPKKLGNTGLNISLAYKNQLLEKANVLGEIAGNAGYLNLAREAIKVLEEWAE